MDINYFIMINEIKAKTLIYEEEHPVHAFTQLGVRILGIVCYKNESTQIILWMILITNGLNYQMKKFSSMSIRERFYTHFLDDNKTTRKSVFK